MKIQGHLFPKRRKARKEILRFSRKKVNQVCYSKHITNSLDRRFLEPKQKEKH